MITMQLRISLFLGISFFIYKIFLQNSQFYKEQRMFILISGIMAVSLPLLMNIIPRNLALSVIYLPAIEVNASKSIFSNHREISILQLVEWFYIVGLSLIVGYYLIALIRFINIRIKSKSENGIIYMNDNISPFSFLKTIYMPVKLKGSSEQEVILIHEKAHIRLYHSLDVILFTIIALLQWFNPFAWLILKSLKELHEYQADQKTIESGIEVEGYCNQVIAHTIGCQLHILVNNFNKNLTLKRLTMITNSKSQKNGKFGFAIATPILLSVFAIVLMFQNQNGNAGFLKSDTQKNSSVTKSDSSAASNGLIFISVEENATFEGGDIDKFRTYIANNIKYPEQALKNKIGGIVIVQFVVNAKGKVDKVNILRGINESLDAEVVRVLVNSPIWQPGKQGGKFVNQQFVIPVVFNLKK